MPSKERVKSKDYQGPLRKPGEQCEPATAKEDDGAQKSASSVNESENGRTHLLAFFDRVTQLRRQCYGDATVFGEIFLLQSIALIFTNHLASLDITKQSGPWATDQRTRKT